jgi:hypothetical protein
MTTIFARSCMIITTRDRFLRVKHMSHLCSLAIDHRSETENSKETLVITFKTSLRTVSRRAKQENFHTQWYFSVLKYICKRKETRYGVCIDIFSVTSEKAPPTRISHQIILSCAANSNPSRSFGRFQPSVTVKANSI